MSVKKKSDFEVALSIATTYHMGQVDKGGNPYIKHPIRVAMTFHDEAFQCVALLHDVLEDSPCTARDLALAGMNSRIVEAVVAITKLPTEDYETEYLPRVAENAIARAVKIADIHDNLNRDRVVEPAARRFLERNRARYYRALAFLDKED